MSTFLTFTLPAPYPLHNKTRRMNYHALAKMKRGIRSQIIHSLGGSHTLPSEPFQHAHIRIERWSTGTPDYDGLVGGAKELLDCLTTPTPWRNQYVKNKYGLGIIVDDSPAHITTEYHAIKCRLCEQKTVVTITPTEGGDQ